MGRGYLISFNVCVSPSPFIYPYSSPKTRETALKYFSVTDKTSLSTFAHLPCLIQYVQPTGFRPGSGRLSTQRPCPSELPRSPPRPAPQPRVQGNLLDPKDGAPIDAVWAAGGNFRGTFHSRFTARYSPPTFRGSNCRGQSSGREEPGGGGGQPEKGGSQRGLAAGRTNRRNACPAREHTRTQSSGRLPRACCQAKGP